MVKEDFVERWTDELMGQLLDAVTKVRSGAEMAIWLRLAAEKVRAGVKQMRQETSRMPSDDVVEAFVKLYPTLEPKAREAVAGRLKASMNGSHKEAKV